MKKLIILSLALCLSLCACTYSGETKIELAQDDISIDGNRRAVDITANVEDHPDVLEEYKDIQNTVITIEKGGTYRISGKREDTQIRVQVKEEESVVLILDGADITCSTAPAILGLTGKDLTVVSEKESRNIINGSHTAKKNDDDVKYDAAISSGIPLILDGEGKLEVNSDNEGIESKLHLTVNNGIYRINSCDDALNASEDNVSVITINGGEIVCNVSPGKEGDGIDSNGTIVINGGTVLSYANENSQDSGLDADGGTTINGGLVLATGNMQDQINPDSKQGYVTLSFKEKQNDVLTVITDENDKPVYAFRVPYGYSFVQLSSDKIINGKYKLYTGGALVADYFDGVYENITSYSVGTQMQHGGKLELKHPEQIHLPNQAMTPHEGAEPPKDFAGKSEKRERPEGMEKMPDFPHGKNPMDLETAVSDIFEITDKAKSFVNIQPKAE